MNLNYGEGIENKAILAEQKLTTTHGFDICVVNADTNLAKSQHNYECNYTFLPVWNEIIRSILSSG